MSIFPGSIASFLGFTPGHTLSADAHASQHNSEQAEIVAAQTKIGTGASTPASGLLLRGNGAGASAWAQVGLTTDITGVLPQANGGTGTTLATGTGKAVYDTSPTIANPNLTTPTISSFVNANHDHTNSAGGGILGTNALANSAVTSSKLSLDFVEATLGANFTSAASNTWQDTGLNITLPTAGTWLLIADIRSSLSTIAGDFASFRYFDTTAGAAVANSERLVGQTQAANNDRFAAPMNMRYTTSVSNTIIRIDIQPGQARACVMESDNNGRTHMMAFRIN